LLRLRIFAAAAANAFARRHRRNPPPRTALANLKAAGQIAAARLQDQSTMPRENDLEGVQDQGGKHGGQKGMPKPEPRPPHGPDQGIVRTKGEEQPRDKARAQQVHGTDGAKQ
jgi:hypothetical protein